LAQQAAEASVGFSAFGIGVDWNDQFLDALVAPSGGQSGYIEKPEEIITHLENRIRGLGNVYAQEMRLLPKWPRQVSVLECFKLSPFAQPLPLDGDYIALGHMEGRAPLSLLLELQVAPQSVPARIKIPLTMTAAIPSTGSAPAGSARKSRQDGTDEQTFSSLVQLVVLQSLDGTEEPPAELVEAVRLLTLHRMYEKAWDEAATGQLQAAAKRMNRLTTRLLESGELDLAHQAHQEAQRIARLGTMSLEGHKQLKYGTRSLMGQRKK
jgi:Ca-activated chloride channel family protein